MGQRTSCAINLLSVGLVPVLVLSFWRCLVARMSANRRRRANNNRGAGFGSYDVRKRADYVIGGSMVGAAGTASAVTSWNGPTQTIAAGGTLAYQMVTLVPAATAVNARPAVGEVQVDAIEGSLFFSTPSVAGLYYIGVGIYISKYTVTGAVWDFRDPTQQTDGVRDDWLYLKVVQAYIPLPAALTMPQMIEFCVTLPRPVIIGSGEALHVGAANNSGSAGTIACDAWLRARISGVS